MIIHTLIGQDEQLKKIVLRTLSELLSMLKDSRQDIGRFWDLVVRKVVRNPWQQTGWRMG